MHASLERWLRWAAPVLVVVAGVILFGWTLNAPLTRDDILVTVENPLAYDAANIPRYFVNDLDWIPPDELATPQKKASRYGLYRPLLVTSYTLDALLWGGQSFGWRLTNLGLHLIASLLVLGLARRLLGSRLGGLAAALVFVVHPIHVEAVAWLLGGRAELLATVFVLASWWLFLDGDRRSGVARWAGDVGSAFLFLLGLFSKENAVVLPAILFLCGGWVCRQKFGMLLIRLLPHLVLLGLFVIIRFMVVSKIGPQAWLPEFANLSPVQRVLSLLTMMVLYLRLAVFPFPLQHPDCYNEVPGSISPLLGALGALLFVGLLGIACWRAHRGRVGGGPSWWAVGLLLFFLCLVPVSHLIPFQVVMAERFLYLPTVALCLVVGWLAARAVMVRPWLPLVAGVPLVAALAAGTVWGNSRWIDLDRYYSAEADCAPRSPDPYNNMGTARLRVGRPLEALPFFEKAVAVAPERPEAYYNIGLALQQLGRMSEAERAYRQTLALSEEHAMAWNNLGVLLQGKGDLTRARDCLQKAIRYDPSHSAPLVNLGNLFLQESRTDEAEQLFRLALRIEPHMTEARFDLARLLEATERTPEAERLYREILKAHPDHAMAHNNLANLLKDRGMRDEAESQYNAALVVEPACVPAHFNLANLLLSRGEAARAVEHYTMALWIQPEYLEAWIGLGVAFLQLSQFTQAVAAVQRATALAPADPRVQRLRTLLGQPQH